MRVGIRRLGFGIWVLGFRVSRVWLLLLTLLAATCSAPTVDQQAARFVGPAPEAREALALPNRPQSIKFAAIGDAGRGDRPQYEVSAQMQAFRKIFQYDFVVMLGDNVYDGGTP